MAPSKAAQAAAPPYAKDERVLCFHHEMLYEAKVLDTRPTEDETSWQYKIHYKGWKNTWDDWVPHDRVRKFTDENKELAAQLHQQMKQLQKGPKGLKGGKGSKANGGSEIGSSRGSEERHASAAAPGRGGPRRNRDYDLEQRQRPESLKQGTKRTYNDFDADIPKPTRRSARPPVASIPFDEGYGTAPRKSARLCRDSNDWSDPKSGKFDTLRVLCSDECLAPDPLLKMPPKNFEYIDANGKLKNPYKYHTQKSQPEPHPKLAAHIKNGTATPARELYYKDMPHDLILPFGGIIRNEHLIVKDSVVRAVRAVGEEAVYKTRLCRALHDTKSDIEESALQNMKSKKRSLQHRAERAFTREWLTFFKTQEEGFHSRPSIKLLIPDHIKALLVDDWENVTKNQTLVPVPSAHPVNKILNDYLDYEMPKRQPGSAQADILEEVVAGLKEYFEKCLGRILLYRFERNQYLEVRDLWTKGEGEWAGKGAGDTYGAEHLCRLLVSLPELIAQTNMDQQSVNRLREELSKMTNWLGKLDRLEKYFVKEYETPTQDYVEKARAV